MHELLDGLVEKGKTGTATDVRKHLSRLFNWAIDREIIAENPLSGLKRKDLQYKADAGRALTDDELRAIWRAADRMTYPFGPYFKLMILTGQRRNEVPAGMKHFPIATNHCGLRRTYISGIERGVRNPTVVILDKIAKALKVPAGALLDEVRGVSRRS